MKRHVLPRRINSIIFLVVLILLVNVIPVFILAQDMYVRAKESLEDATVASQYQWEQWYMRNLEEQLNVLWQAQYASVVSRSTLIVRLSGSSVFSAFEQSSAKLTLQRRLIEISAGRNYISRATLYLLDQDLVISQDAITYGIGEETLAWLEQRYANRGNMLTWDGTELLLIASSASDYTSDKPPLVICVTHLLPTQLFISDWDKETLSDHVLLFLDNYSDDILYASEAVTLPGDILSAIGEAEDMTPLYLSTAIDGRDQLVFYYRSDAMDITLVEIVDQGRLFASLVVLENRFFRILMVMLLINILLIGVLFRMIYRPARKLVNGLNRFASGELGVELSPKYLTREFHEIFEGFNGMSRSIKEMVHDNYELHILTQKAQLKQLQLQINPHFLYNSYFILHSMLMNEDYETAGQMCMMLGEYLQYITHIDELTATLAHEFNHARAYAGIQQIRFSRSVKLDICEFDERLADIEVPKLILQPLVENAFLHGMNDVTEGGMIRVRIVHEADRLRILVEDNGNRMTDERIAAINTLISGEGENGNSVALANINHRLRIRFGDGSGLRASRSSLGGLCMTLDIGGIACTNS